MMSPMLSKEDRQLNLIEDIRTCKGCSLCNIRNGNPVVGAGPLRADIVVIGEAPGEQEEKEGYPFVRRAPAGEVLTNVIMDALGFGREHLFLTNVVLCRPVSQDKYKKNDTPIESYMNACAVHLREQLEIIDPKVIIAMGATASSSLTGISLRASQYRQKLFWYGYWPIICTWHPSYIARQGKRGSGGKGCPAYNEMVSDIRLAWNLRCSDSVAAKVPFKDGIQIVFDNLTLNA